MKARAILANAIFENVKVFKIQDGAQFRIELYDVQSSDQLRWFVNNDEVLDYSVDSDGHSADFQATGQGASEVQIQVGENRRAEFFMEIEIFGSEAVGFNIEIGEPEPKP